MARKTLTDLGVRALKPRAARYSFPDPQLAGHYVRVTDKGAKSFAAVARDPNGKQIWTTIGSTEMLPIEEARGRARDIIQRVRAGLPAIALRGETFGSVCENWLKRYVDANGLRTAHEIRRLLNSHVLPVWKDREFVGIRKGDVTGLLDEIEDDHGAHQADATLTVVGSLMRWHAARTDDYAVPISRGMKRQSQHARARSRILDDDELRKIWNAAEADGAFGAGVRLCLLTAQRKSKIFNMRWEQIENGEWTIPKEPREKDNAGVLVLPDMARQIIDAQPKMGDNPFVFAGRGDGPINGMSKSKTRLDKAAGVTGWKLHDLRRTARSLMSRARVLSEHAERVMGHAIGGVEGIYDRFQYKVEKGEALAKLAALISDIVAPSDKVVAISKGKRR